jgi:hypothetical protein
MQVAPLVFFLLLGAVSLAVAVIIALFVAFLISAILRKLTPLQARAPNYVYLFVGLIALPASLWILSWDYFYIKGNEPLAWQQILYCLLGSGMFFIAAKVGKLRHQRLSRR